MPKLYNESYSHRSFILSEGRDARPSVRGGKAACPFCKGNEEMIEHIWLEHSTLEGDVIRVINNKYPVCTAEGPLYGYHDVIVDTLEHDQQPFELSLKHWQVFLQTMMDRYRMLEADKRLKLIQIFKNNGCEAGASIEHSHWQLVALEHMPTSLQKQYEAEKAYYIEHESCRQCDGVLPIHHEHHIYETQHWLVLAPLYSSIPYETCIVPKVHVSHFGQLSQMQLEDMGNVLSKVLGGQQKLLPGIHYNICFMGSVLGEFPWYHFHIRVIPRKGQFAGFELATGCYISCVSATTHSMQLRAILNQLEGE
ncbi:MAG: galactose-1-phosphate uridylyltransferase [Cellulosilyticaceae bacterium]